MKKEKNKFNKQPKNESLENKRTEKHIGSTYKNMLSHLKTNGYEIKNKLITTYNTPTPKESKFIVYLVKNHNYDYTYLGK